MSKGILITNLIEKINMLNNDEYVDRSFICTLERLLEEILESKEKNYGHIKIKDIINILQNYSYIDGDVPYVKGLEFIEIEKRSGIRLYMELEWLELSFSIDIAVNERGLVHKSDLFDLEDGDVWH